MGDSFTYAAHRSAAAAGSRWSGNTASRTSPRSPRRAPRTPADRASRHSASLPPAAGRSVRGLAAVGRRPRGRAASFSLADLKRLPSRTQITRHTCEEGWTAIGEWTGVPLSAVLDAAGILPSASFVVFHSLRRLDRQHRPARRPAPADDPGLRHERAGSSDPARRARAAARRAAAGLQEHEIPPAHRRDGRVRRWRKEGEHSERMGVVHGDLKPVLPLVGMALDGQAARRKTSAAHDRAESIADYDRDVRSRQGVRRNDRRLQPAAFRRGVCRPDEVREAGGPGRPHRRASCTPWSRWTCPARGPFF